MKSPALLLAALISDIKGQSVHTKGLDRDYLTIVARFENEGISFLTYTLPILDDALLSGLEHGRFLCPSNFAKRRRSALPRLFSGLLENIFDSHTGALLEHPCVECVHNLHTLLRMFKKLTLSSKNQQKLVLKAQRKYSALEAHIVNHRSKIDDRRWHLLGRVVQSALGSFHEFDGSSMNGKHGPGAVGEKMSPNDKWRYLSESITLDSRLESMGYCESMNETLYPQIQPTEARGYLSEVISVPKNSSSVRLITIEPFLNQFIQGGLKKELWRMISRSPLSSCLRLDRQELNANLALEGSLTREWATLDLSSASDLVDNELVHFVFRNHEAFLRMLMDSRTPLAKFGSKTFLHEKFAGMGNATTFPVQSIIYALLCICAILDYEGRTPSYRRVKHIASNCIQIYGDDIIVKSEYSSSVIEWLTVFGFIINDGKSFSKGNFRESCGVDAYMGIDITPVYVRHWPSNICTDSKALCNLVAASNSLWERCYYKAATFIQNEVEESIGRLPLVRKDAGSLGWHTRHNATSIERWNKHLHRFEYRGRVVKSKTKLDPLDGYAALLKFFHLPFILEEHGCIDNIRRKDHLEKSDIRYKSFTGLQWCST